MFQSCILARLAGAFGGENNLDDWDNHNHNHNHTGIDGDDLGEDGYGNHPFGCWAHLLDGRQRTREGATATATVTATSRHRIRSVLKIDPFTGALKVPVYQEISRADHCPLLKSAWGQDWGEVLRLCHSQPSRTLHKTKHSGRTALHLSTFDRRCPPLVARALLRANRHMIAVRDSNHYTPLHIVAFFASSDLLRGRAAAGVAGNNMVGPSASAFPSPSASAVLPTESATKRSTDSSEEQQRAASEEARAEAESVLSLFCDTAIMVEQELRTPELFQGQNNKIEQQTSPLYLAAKRGAPLSILKILLETRSRTHWIAPSTGGEPYFWDGGGDGTPDSNAPAPLSLSSSSSPSSTTSLSSPLEIMLREDRLRSSAGHYRDAYLLEEEEDGNHPPRNDDRNGSHQRAVFRAPSASTRLRIRPRQKASPARDRGLSNRSPLHPEEIAGVPHLVQKMRRVAIDRCHRHFHPRDDVGQRQTNHKTRSDDEECDQELNTAKQQPQSGLDPRSEEGDRLLLPMDFTQSQKQCLDLWEKCIELLVTAGGGGVPLLEVVVDHPRRHQEQLPPFQKYGILHACVCCKMPVPSLVEVALLVFPEQAYQRDVRHGMIPLHHVLRAEHKYAYATSSLLAILLQGRTPNAPNKKTVVPKKQFLSSSSSSSSGTRTEQKSSVDAAASNDRKQSRCCANPSVLSPNYLQPTVLLPLPSESGGDGNHDGAEPKERRRKRTGPTPLAYAIKLRLPMDTVIDQLLEADSYDSLRTVDPETQLPPFALVATKVPRHSAVKGYLINCNQGSKPQTTTMPSPSSARAKRKESLQSDVDIVTAAIESTLNALSSGDGDTLRSTRNPLPTTSSTENRKAESRARDTASAASVANYKLDDVYRLLLAHPQVLAQHIP